MAIAATNSSWGGLTAPTDWRATHRGAGIGLAVGTGFGALAARGPGGFAEKAYYLLGGMVVGTLIGGGVGGFLDSRGGSIGAVGGAMLGATGLALSAGHVFRNLPGTGPVKVAAGVGTAAAGVLAFAGAGALLGTALDG